MTVSPEVTVLLPVHDAEHTVAESLQSITAQTFRDLEILVIDDGSADASLTIVEALSRGDSRIVVRSREQQGLTKTLNEGVRLARGQWIARMDADDVAHPERIRKQLEYAERHALDIVGSAHQCFGVSQESFDPPESHAAICHQLFLWRNPFSHPTVLARTELLRNCPYLEDDVEGENGQPVSPDTASDYALWLELARLGHYRMGNTRECLLHYRVHEAQISTRLESQQDIMVRQVVGAAIRKLVPAASSYDLGLHYRSVCGPFDNPEQLRDYSVFLATLYQALSSRYGRSSEVFHHWKRCLKRNTAMVDDDALKAPDWSVDES